MLKDTNLETLSDEQLIRLAEVVDAYLFKQPANGEEYHPDYRNNKQSFNLLVKQTVAFRREVAAYFQDLAKKIPELVNLKKIKADDASEMIDEDFFDDEATILASILHTAVTPIYKNGAAAEAGGSSGVDGNDAPSQKFLRKYTVQLANDVTKETKKRVTESVRTSLELGEDRDALTARLTDIVDDDYRAEMIAQTESIRAYTQGRLAVGVDLGYEGKEWQWPGDSDCKVCPALQELGPIAIDEDFDIGDDYGPYESAPAHPWCQCRIKLIESLDEDVEASEKKVYARMDDGTIKAGWITKNGAHIFIPDDTATVIQNSTGKSIGQLQEEHERAVGLGLLTDLNNSLSNNDYQKAEMFINKINSAKDTEPIAKYKSMANTLFEKAREANLKNPGAAVKTEREAIEFSRNSTMKQTLYHGSSAENADQITKQGFKTDDAGLVGKGVYFSTTQEDAHTFGTDVTQAKIDVTKIKVIDNVTDIASEATAMGIPHDALLQHIHDNYDAVEVKKQGWVAVFDPTKAVPFK